VLEDIIEAGRGLHLVQRAPHPDELGGPPQPAGGEVALAIVRGGVRLPLDGSTGPALAAGDVIVLLQSR
jgi:hypothetical protein